MIQPVYIYRKYKELKIKTYRRKQHFLQSNQKLPLDLQTNKTQTWDNDCLRISIVDGNNAKPCGNPVIQMKSKNTPERNMYTYHIKEMLFVSTCRKTLIKFGMYAALLFIAVIISLIPHFLTNKKQLLPHRYTRFATDLKYILFYNDPSDKKKPFHHFEKDPPYPSGQSLFIRQKCSFINCYVTYNKSLLNGDWNFDAIVFDIHEIKDLKLDDINLTRSSHQKYIFKSLESAERYPLCYPFYDGFFNWTWSYKLNSDIPHPFLNIYDENNTLIGPTRNVSWLKTMKRTDRLKSKLKNKNKAVAWVVGKCKLKYKHKDFIDEFQNELKGYNYSLDIYGPCGKMECPHGQSYKCYKMIEKNYYFQLVIEDSFTEDYVSDKLVKILTHVTIPIVLGGADYNNFIPPGAFINVQSFDMKKLGAIIDYLIRNPKMYEYFFDWTNHYYYTPRPSNYICDLCAKLNDDINFNIQKTYNNFREWWNSDYVDICRRMQLLNMFSRDYF